MKEAILKEATLEEILSAREARAAEQSRMLSDYGRPLISFSMNIAGPVKNSPLIKKAFEEGCRLLEDALKSAGITVIEEKKKDAVTGCELLCAVDAGRVCGAEGEVAAGAGRRHDKPYESLRRIKDICVSIEEGSELGRLFDMDVIDPGGMKIERSVERKCLICGRPGKGCASRRVHLAGELQEKTRKIILSYFQGKEAERVSAMVTDALMEEVLTTPKPGLVDQNNNGSHTDMDIDTFRASAEALRDYWKRCFQIGCRTSDLTPEETFAALRKEGIKAETEMYRATGGVNTHMGAIFLMGTVCGAIGRLQGEREAGGRPSGEGLPPEIVAAECAEMTSKILEREPRKGARSEIAAGIPGVTCTGLPVFCRLLSEGADRNQAGAGAFIALVARGTDTNMIRRGGAAAAAKAAERAAELVRQDKLLDTELIKELDDQFIGQNLSPGGCADLLAITYFLNDYCG